ncbi:MAG: hypothetical protein K0R93_504 [Anaerosolibacter sp.]|jgi:hypothetical protein|uniref:stalk domain-containing protein n=1 Tax=Anaerosolibacter sp. TaxID=1872527 RepID=UPI0026240783|nr:stalk domain-containing protein [Anaerosolibacter sp.]MDF2545606.1 hypothetical protein [Anaerosolibacter sp.]
MKKKRFIFILITLMLVLSPSLISGKTISQTITAWFYDIKVNVDGQALNFSSSPFIYNNHTYVSLNDVAAQLGYTIQWDDTNKTMTLASSANHGVALNTLKYDIDRKNLEISNLKYQLQQKELELSMLREPRSSSSSSTSNTTLSRLEDDLEDDFYRYKDDYVNMRFEYTLTQSSSGDIRVRMDGDFYRSSSTWRNRDSYDFRDFILEICEEIDSEYNEDIDVYVYDEDGYRIGYYEYSDSKNRIVDYDEY